MLAGGKKGKKDREKARDGERKVVMRKK